MLIQLAHKFHTYLQARCIKKAQQINHTRINAEKRIRIKTFFSWNIFIVYYYNFMQYQQPARLPIIVYLFEEENLIKKYMRISSKKDNKPLRK